MGIQNSKRNNVSSINPHRKLKIKNSEAVFQLTSLPLGTNTEFSSPKRPTAMMIMPVIVNQLIIKMPKRMSPSPTKNIMPRLLIVIF